MRISMSEQRFRQQNNNSIRQSNNPPSSVNFSGRSHLYPGEKSFSWFTNFDSFKQRMWLGIAALAFQPMIDYCNPMADEKTRKFSVLKTVVKAVVGTATGLLIRGSIRKVIEKQLTNPQKFVARIKNEKTAKYMKEILASKEKTSKFTDNFASVCGLVGVAVGDFTFDMPLARYSIHKVATVLGMTEPEKKEAKE